MPCPLMRVSVPGVGGMTMIMITMMMANNCLTCEGWARPVLCNYVVLATSWPKTWAWGHLGLSWAMLEPCWGHIEVILGAYWAFLGPRWGHLGSLLGHPSGHLEAMNLDYPPCQAAVPNQTKCVGPCWGHLGPILGLPCGLPGPILG